MSIWPFELRLDRAQLDAAILRDRGDAGRQAAREADEHVLDRRDAVILRREDLRMIGLERGLGLVLLLLAEPEEALDVRLAVRAVLPLAGRPPRELRRLRRALQRFARVQQCLDVDSVVDASSSPCVSPFRCRKIADHRREDPDHTTARTHAGRTAPRGDMIARMATRAPKTAAGSVGTVETQFLDLPKPLRLDCGRERCIRSASPTRPTGRCRRRATTSSWSATR